MRYINTAKNFFYRISPRLFWDVYGSKARELGIDSVCLILSYDCDTPEDISASKELFAWLNSRKIPATFAVPGAQLKLGAGEYRDLKKSGAIFINHGGANHTEWRSRRYWSTTFYDQMPATNVINDIRSGHEIFTEVFGEKPKGFRAPHFGHFQKDRQLALIYETLHHLGGYQFATTTVPVAALQNGPVYKTNSLYEIPVLGSYNWPLRIFDSWGHRRDKLSRQVKNSYAMEFTDTVKTLSRAKIPALLNYYADPSHVAANQAYYRTLDFALEAGAVFLDYASLLELINLKKG